VRIGAPSFSRTVHTRHLATFALLLAVPLQGRASPQAATKAPAAPYHIVKTIPLPFLKRTDGPIAFNAASGRLFVPDGKDVVVINADTGELVGRIAKTDHVSQIAFAPDINRGFIVDSERRDLTIFDPRSFTTVTRVGAGNESSSIEYSPSMKEVFTTGPSSKDCRVFDAMTGKTIKTVKLGGYALSSIQDSEGHIYFGLSPRRLGPPPVTVLGAPTRVSLGLDVPGEIAVLNSRSSEIVDRWKEPSCTGMRLVGIDDAHRRLVAGCKGSSALIDADTGEITALASIAGNPLFYLQFSAHLGDAFVVITHPFALVAMHESSPSQLVDTGIIARGFPQSIALDDKTGRLFIIDSDEKMVQTGFWLNTPGRPTPANVPEAVPGTFRVLVFAMN
ncbi:MAG: YncE family protein, partial [Candidatus Acidiferrales bacterium]